MSAIAKRPGFDNRVGNRNRRISRYASQVAGGGNRTSKRHKEVHGTTIGHDAVPTPDEITDSGNGLAGFEVHEVVQTQGSANNEGDDVVQTVVAGALGVDDGLTTEAAGAALSIRSRNNVREGKFS